MRVSAINRPHAYVCTVAAQAPALAREAFNAGRLQQVPLALTQVRRIRAEQQPNEGGRWVRHRVRLSAASCVWRPLRIRRAARLRRRTRGVRPW